MRVLKVLPARETSNGMEQMAAPAVLFLLSEAVCLRGCRQCSWPASRAPSSRSFQASLLYSQRLIFQWFCPETDLLGIQ